MKDREYYQRLIRFGEGGYSRAQGLAGRLEVGRELDLGELLAAEYRVVSVYDDLYHRLIRSLMPLHRTPSRPPRGRIVTVRWLSR